MKTLRMTFLFVAIAMFVVIPAVSLAETAADAPKAESGGQADPPKAEAPAAAESRKAEAPPEAPKADAPGAAEAPAQAPAK